MNSVEFIEEIRQNCDASVLEKYKKFQEYQKLNWDVLIWFNDFCKKNHIAYQLAYGSLLGAVRDSGQIPWDYDIDTYVNWTDRERLISLLQKEIPDNFYFVCAENDNYSDYMMRIVPKGYDELYLHVDIFFLIPTSDDSVSRLNHQISIRKLYFMRHYKYYKPIHYAKSTGNNSMFVFSLLKKLQYMFVPLKKIQKLEREISQKYLNADTKAITTFDFWSPMITYLFDVSECIPCNIDGVEFPICKNYDKMLTYRYGNYNRIMPFEKRLNEFLRHYEALERYGHIDR